MEIGPDGSMEVCGGKELKEQYLLKLVHCMEKLFFDKNKVVPSLVSDVDQYVFKVAGRLSVHTVHDSVNVEFIRLCGCGN